MSDPVSPAERLAQARVFEEVLVSRGLLVRAGPDPDHPGGQLFRIGRADPQTIAAAVEEMEIRCGWSVQDTLDLMNGLVNASVAEGRR